MKIDLINQIDQTQFHVNEHVFNGEVLTLVIPRQMGCAWTQENKIFRSSLWNSDGELVSASFPKFVNWGEKPDVFPVPSSLKNTVITEKLDGSTLIVSKYKGDYIIRTRGTIDATAMEQNGHEIEYFKNEVLVKLFKSHLISGNSDTWDYSFIFEWTSKLNTIVINYGDVPQFFLIGIVYHGDYRLSSQLELDNYAWELGLQRPTTYTFTDVDDLIANIEKWEGKEGVCVYSKDGQEIHKVKSAWYLMLHHMKSELSSTEKVIDVWVAQGYPSYSDFYNYIATTFDYELAETARGNISNICDGYKEVQKIIVGMRKFLTEQVLPMPTRKLQAVVITQSYGKTNRASYLFKLLDGKELGGDDIKKLMFQVLKK